MNMGNLTLGQAAKASGISKSALSKALKNGRVSYVAKTDAGYEIDPSELFRVFPPKPTQPVAGEQLSTPPETGRTVDDPEKQLLRELLRERDARIEDLRSERDDWKEQAQRLALAAPAAPQRRGWFGKA